MTRAWLDPAATDGGVFDMDGVVADTARVHEAAWKATFDPILRELGRDAPFTHEEYRRHVDGMSRRDGAAAFLCARGIEPDPALIDRISAEKNVAFGHQLERGARQLPGAKALLSRMRRAGMRVGLFTASRNAGRVLKAVALDQAFDAVVDGVFAEEEGLAGKPAPDLPLACASRLAIEPARCALFEDAEAGIRAGRAGGFGRVIGVAKGADAERLREVGADLVVASLAEVGVLET